MAWQARPTTRSRGPAPRWPPSAEPVGVDLSLAAMLLIFGGLTLLGYLHVWAAPLDRGLPPWVRWRTAGDLVEVLVWFGVVAGLGWRTAVGLVKGGFSWFGVLPIVALTIASLAAAGLPGEALVGPGLQFMTVVGVSAACLTEEVIFRGFLFHGLTRRLGGRTAMLASSLLFAVYHVPRGIREDWSSEFMVTSLISYFAIGMYLCLVRAETGSLLLPAVIHSLWNLTHAGIWIWAIPAESFPSSFAFIWLAICGTGLFIAAGLLIEPLLQSDVAFIRGPPDKGKVRRRSR
jgi:membrane protease YdiL (CAAX protease family)